MNIHLSEANLWYFTGNPSTKKQSLLLKLPMAEKLHKKVIWQKNEGREANISMKPKTFK